VKLILIILSLFFSKQKHHDYAYHTSAKVDGIFYKAIVNNDQSVSIVLQSGKTVLTTKAVISKELKRWSFWILMGTATRI
jgi:hypothetical protein